MELEVREQIWLRSALATCKSGDQIAMLEFIPIRELQECARIGWPVATAKLSIRVPEVKSRICLLICGMRHLSSITVSRLHKDWTKVLLERHS